MVNIPSELRYTKDHEWLKVEGSNVTFGITDFAQDALGDIVFVSLPKVGQKISAGETCGEVESTKSVSDIFAPVSGEVIEVNANLSSTPETINQDPYLNGWMVKVALDQSIDSFELLTAEEYIALSEG